MNQGQDDERVGRMNQILPNPIQLRQLELQRQTEQVTSRIVHPALAEHDQSPRTHSDNKKAREKRSKACTSCRRSKVKCVKVDSEQVCKRCQAQGLQCIYEYKIASYKVVSPGTGSSSSSSSTNTSNNTVNETSVRSMSRHNSEDSGRNNGRQVSISNLLNPSDANPARQSEVNWKNSVDRKLGEFDSKLGSILSLLEEKNRHADTEHLTGTAHFLKSMRDTSNSDSMPLVKRRRIEEASVSLGDILTIEQAKQLFNYFDEHISSQLFGYNVHSYSVNDLWTSCPLLVATICCIASVHHPTLHKLSLPLKTLIRSLSLNVLFSMPATEMQAFNTILALCFCGFWFQKDQMFTGLALQLAKSVRLLSPHNGSSKIPKKDALKLWYLLYILDGQQALVFNRDALLNPKNEALAEAKTLLLQPESVAHESSVPITPPETETGTDADTHYSDIRLVSQVEYHQAIDSAFSGDAWGLLRPASFGIPFRTNLELDKWMVRWTVLLVPMKHCPTWSSKSTLIYYNFAKMHINSAAVRKLQIVNSELPSLDECEDDPPEDSSDDDLITPSGEPPEGLTTRGNRVGNEDDDDESDTADESNFMASMPPAQSRKIYTELALSAAKTVLNIVLNDTDILAALKYAPIHIHIMLYYAALLVLKPPTYLSPHQKESFTDALNSVKLVKRLRLAVLSEYPTDRDFGNRLVAALDKILKERAESIAEAIARDTDQTEKLLQLENVLTTDNKLTPQEKKSRKIMAWPGVDAGHPDEQS